MFQSVYNWYSRESVQKSLIEISKNREVVSVFKDGSFGKRPDVIQYPGDILQAIAEGAVAFHGSVEQWSNPMQLDVGMNRIDLDKLRIGWDIILDPDMKDFEIGKLATKQIIEALKDHGIKNYSVKFSVDYSEPLIVKENGKIRVESIGEFIDSIIRNSGKVEKIREVDGEKVYLRNNIETFCFDPQTLKIVSKPISYVLRHRIQEPLYEISLKSGRKVKVTGSHGIFILDNGQIKTKKVSELKIDDYVLIPKVLPSPDTFTEEINLIEELLKLDEKDINGIYIELKIDDKLKNKRILLTTLRNLKIQNPELLRDSFLAFGEIKIPSIIKISDEFARLLGYYVSEGFSLTRGTYDIVLSFGSHEKEIIDDVNECIKKVFGVKVKSRNPQPSATQLQFGGKLLTLVFEKIFKCGKYAINKRVPSVIFGLPRRMKKEFLKGYFCDATIHHGKEIIFKTISKDLSSDLSYLFLQLGIVSSISTENEGERIFPEYISKTQKVYKISIHSQIQTKEIEDIIPNNYNIIHKNHTRIETPVAIPTNHSGLRYLYSLVNMKRKPKMRSRIFKASYCPEMFLEVVEYIEKNQNADWKILILKELLKGSLTTKELLSCIRSRKTIYRILRELERDGIISRLNNSKESQNNVLPFLWSIKDKAKAESIILKNKENLEKSIEVIKFLKILAQGELGFAPIKSIKRVKPTNDYVYDISIKNYENFVTGFGGVICHNTGGKGFHIGIPFEALPEKINLKPITIQYPELHQTVIEYIKWYIHDQLKEELLALDTPINLAQRAGKSLDDITSEEGIEPFKIISMDVFGSRHLIRLPYSLHESSMLVSMPIKPENIDKFEKEQALPEKVKVEEKFLIPKYDLQDAEALTVEALDWATKYRVEIKEEIPKVRKFIRIKTIPEQYFPPCVSTILKGLTDGKKRSVFILVNFLRNMGWDLGKIEKKLAEWNEKNYPSLRANYLRGQLRWHFRQERNLLPPNCDNEIFYRSMGVCNPDSFCKGGADKITIKNPVNYPFRKMKKR